MIVTCPPRPVKQKLATNIAVNPNGLRANRSSTGSTNSINSINGFTNSSSSNNAARSSLETEIGSNNAIGVKRNKQQEEDFYRFRPSFHLIAPKNWMNDPCGPCFDESTGLYHVLYQYNPKGATWGNMSWLHATSKDLIHWQHVEKEPTLQPKLSHDAKGVFSGAMVAQGPKGEKGMLTIFYTAVSYLPIHYTKPYHWGCEKLAMAISIDGGKTWKRDESTSVLLESPPKEFKGKIVSWRDPFISSWPEMDVQLGLPPNTYLYGLIAGGLLNQTPTAFLYKIDQNNLANWSFISTVTEVGLDFNLPNSPIGMGRNWEVCNFFTLPNSISSSSTTNSQFLLMNVEGVGKDNKERYPMWAQCSFAKDSPEGRMTPFKNGIFDYGSLYAATTFYHTPTQRRILWGWVTEDDLAEHRYDQQGWSGCISLPREIFQLTFDKVDPKMLQNSQISSTFDFEFHEGEGVTLNTVGCRPAVETLDLRQGAKHTYLAHPDNASMERLAVSSRNFEVKFDVVFDRSTQSPKEEVGIIICHDKQDLEKGVKISFSNDQIHIERNGTTTDPDVKVEKLSAPFTPLHFIDDAHVEPLHFQLFLDNSVLELFVNDRLCITSRIYCEDDQANQISLINNGNNNKGYRYEDFNIWTGLQKAMLDESMVMEGGGDELGTIASDSVAHL